MKAVTAIIALLLLFAFLSGCAQQGEGGEEEEPTPTPTPEETPELDEQELNQELDDFASTLISEDSEIDLGEIA